VSVEQRGRRTTFEREIEMPDFDVEAFVAKLDRWGMKLTSVPLADGKLRVNRWRMLNASEHTQQIHDLWATHIGDSQERIDALASHLAKAAPPAASIRFSRLRTGPETAAASDAATASRIETEPRDGAGSSIGTTAQPLAASPPETDPRMVATPQPVVPSPRIIETAVGVSNPIGVVAKAVPPRPAGPQPKAGWPNPAASQNASPSHAATLQKIADMLSSDRSKKPN
jgi:hypothetical protein